MSGPAIGDRGQHMFIFLRDGHNIPSPTPLLIASHPHAKRRSLTPGVNAVDSHRIRPSILSIQFWLFSSLPSHSKGEVVEYVTQFHRNTLPPCLLRPRPRSVTPPPLVPSSTSTIYWWSLNYLRIVTALTVPIIWELKKLHSEARTSA